MKNSRTKTNRSFLHVHSENPLTGERALTTSALLTFVALDADGKRVEVPQLKLETAEERAAAEQATARRKDRLARRTNETASWHALVTGSHSA